MAWSLRASSSAGGALGGNLTINKPTGTADNDLLLITFYTEVSARITTLAGWTKVGETGPSGSSTTYCTTYYKRASSEGSSYTWTLSGSSWRTAVMSAFSGGLTSGTFLDVSAAKAATAGQDGPLATTITTTAADDLAVIGTSDFQGDGTGVASSGYTEAVDFAESAIYYKVWTSAGATGQITLNGGDPGGWTTYHQAFFIASGAQTVTVNQVTETDTPQAITKQKIRAVGQNTETDTAQAVTKQKLMAVAQISETDTAQAINRQKILALGQISETDTAQPIARGQQLIPVAQVTETDTAQAVTTRKQQTAGQVTETDTAHAVTFAFWEQEGYRFRNDDGSETTATWNNAQDAGINIGLSEAFRLRVLINATGDLPASAFRIEYRVAGSVDPWTVIEA